MHFKNELVESTTVHWHGVRVPIEMDGVPGISQPPVERGESFTYDFVLRDAGLYWYHPHVMSAAQVGFGLHGALLVEDEADGVDVADEATLVLSDIGFDKRGELEPADSGGSAGMVYGREGTYVLVNGKHRPTLRARAGAPQRWRIVNAAKSRFFLFDLEGQPLTVIGGDGGLQERPVTKDAVLVTPGERVDVIVTPKGAPGSTLTLRALLYNRGYGSVEYRNDEDLLTVVLSDAAPVKTPSLASVKRSIVPPPTAGATPVNMTFTLPPVDAKGHSEFRINDVPFWNAKPFRARLGETQIWTIKNDTQWDHPFHLHGYFFMVLDANGASLRPLAWKDTVNIPMKSTTRMLVTFDERPGEWDDSLPHPRPRRWQVDGHRPGRRSGDQYQPPAPLALGESSRAGARLVVSSFGQRRDSRTFIKKLNAFDHLSKIEPRLKMGEFYAAVWEISYLNGSGEV